MKDFGYRPVVLEFPGGYEIAVMARYWCRRQAAREKGKGASFGLMLLGVCDRATPALASEVAQLAAALSSFEDAQARLQQRGVKMSIRRIATIAYPFSRRARQRQELEGMGIAGSLSGKRVVVSMDGGRLRVRKPKRGKKTKKGRSRYHTDWREPKLPVIHTVDEKGRIDQEFAPVIDGTLQGPDEVFRLVKFYLAQLGIAQAAKILFIADGAKWIWQRERDYLLRNVRPGRLNYAKTRRAKLPMGSGTMESAVRRVVNLRLKGASIFWTEEHAEQMLLLRTYYKSHRWQVPEQKTFAPPLATAA